MYEYIHLKKAAYLLLCNVERTSTFTLTLFMKGDKYKLYELNVSMSRDLNVKIFTQTSITGKENRWTVVLINDKTEFTLG
jgi:hypothetical protein